MVPSNRDTASDAAWAVPMVTKAKPRGWPVSRSVGIATSRTSPTSAKTDSNDSREVRNERLPAYSLVARCILTTGEGSA